MKINIGFVGYGSFGPSVISYFMLHPDVNKVALAELIPERREAAAKTHGLTEIYDSFDDMLKNGKDINCIALHAQRHIHGDMVIRALKAGKHVYSAVPMAMTVEEVEQIVDLVKQTRLTYVLGENRYYDPTVLLCRELYTSGRLGRFLYGEAQYTHDMSHFYSYKKYTGRDNWAGKPPMHYCTHSVSMILSAVDEKVTRVSCMGCRDSEWDHMFAPGKNLWDNPYINETAIMRLSGGSVMRINEFRRRVWKNPPTYIGCMNGTRASYERSMDRHVLQYCQTSMDDIRTEDVSERVTPTKNKDGSAGYAPIVSADRLPEAYKAFKMHHDGSHPFAIDDFVRAVKTGRLPPINAWMAARYMLPGLIAHKSAMLDGEPLMVPDPGDPPSDWAKLEY